MISRRHAKLLGGTGAIAVLAAGFFDAALISHSLHPAAALFVFILLSTMVLLFALPQQPRRRKREPEAAEESPAEF
jgi:hypothetical protein